MVSRNTSLVLQPILASNLSSYNIMLFQTVSVIILIKIEVISVDVSLATTKHTFSYGILRTFALFSFLFGQRRPRSNNSSTTYDICGFPQIVKPCTCLWIEILLMWILFAPLLTTLLNEVYIFLAYL